MQQLIAPLGTLAGAFLGFLGALHLQRRTARTARQHRIADLAGEALAAAGELHTALTAYRLHWTGGKPAWPTLAIGLVELLAARDLRRAAGPAMLRTADASVATGPKPPALRSRARARV